MANRILTETNHIEIKRASAEFADVLSNFIKGDKIVNFKTIVCGDISVDLGVRLSVVIPNTAENLKDQNTVFQTFANSPPEPLSDHGKWVGECMDRVKLIENFLKLITK